MRVLIAGGGIGGAALGVALARRGVRADIVEKRTARTDGGAGIVLGPNVMAALGPLGLEEAAGAVGTPVRRMTLMDADGTVLARTPAEVPGYRWPGTGFLRSTLHGLLHDALPTPPRVGVAAERFAPCADGVRVGFSDGCEGVYTLVVGADGIRSALREALNPGFRPRYAGQTCWRVVVDGDPGPEGAVELWGPGRRFGAVPIAGRTYLYLTMDAEAGAPPAYRDLAGFRALWDGFAGPVPELLARIPSLDAMLHNDLEDGIPPRWRAPGQVLLGDAAHAVTPNLGQGAGLAIEDAACLAALLTDGSAPDDALARYEALRRPRAEGILTQSYRIGQLAHLRNGWLRAARNLALGWTPESVHASAYARVVRDMRGVPV